MMVGLAADQGEIKAAMMNPGGSIVCAKLLDRSAPVIEGQTLTFILPKQSWSQLRSSFLNETDYSIRLDI